MGERVTHMDIGGFGEATALGVGRGGGRVGGTTFVDGGTVEKEGV